MHDARIRPRISSIAWLFDALREETLGFRFDQPVHLNLDAGQGGSLHYYLYNSAPTWSQLILDANHIALMYHRTVAPCYHPPYIAWWGLMNLEQHLRSENPQGLDVFLRQVDWLRDHAVRRLDGAVVWPSPMDEWMEGAYLKAGWISGHTQGLVISALVRGHRIKADLEVTPLLMGAARVFHLSVDCGGIRTVCDGHVLYDECPGYRPPGILDGFMTSLLGLYDLFVETQDAGLLKLFSDGIAGLRHTLPRWDYRGKWSWYGSHAYLAPPLYHAYHCAQLRVLGALANEPAFAHYADTWSPRNLTPLGRHEILLMFVLTKNLSRLRLRTWRRETVQRKRVRSSRRQ